MLPIEFVTIQDQLVGTNNHFVKVWWEWGWHISWLAADGAVLLVAGAVLLAAGAVPLGAAAVPLGAATVLLAAGAVPLAG